MNSKEDGLTISQSWDCPVHGPVEHTMQLKRWNAEMESEKTYCMLCIEEKMAAAGIVPLQESYTWPGVMQLNRRGQ